MPYIRGFRWDSQNEAHCAAHGVWPDDLEWILAEGEYVLIRNRKGMAASHLLVGRRRDGAPITAAIRETSTPGIWRPVSAWFSKPREAALLD